VHGLSDIRPTLERFDPKLRDYPSSSASVQRSTTLRTILFLLLITAGAIVIHGYHVGIEDQAIYLPAIKLHLNHSLYPHDAELFLPQTRPTLIDELVAWTVQGTHLPVDWSVFLWHLISIFALLFGCYRIAKRAFPSDTARWGGVGLVTALLTIPVAGTALYLADQYLHPRALATAFVLFALVEVLDRRWAIAALWFFGAVAIHVQMAFFGGLLLLFMIAPLPSSFCSYRTPIVSAIFFTPFSSLFQRSSPEWREAMLTRSQHFLLRWEWYEWLGVIAPLFILWWFVHISRKRTQAFKTLSVSLFWYSAFMLVAAMVTTIPARFERLTPYQPLRAFHLVYLLMFLLGGGLIAEFLLKNKVWRWLLLFVPLCFGMFVVQRNLFPNSRHIEWPGVFPRNEWVQAFLWIRQNTPTDAYFAMDPHYLSSPGEDYHGFRGLAERSQMADWDKDPGVVTLFPAAAPNWSRQVHALDNWSHFGPADFQRIKRDFGVNWFILERNETMNSATPASQGKIIPPDGMDCPYQNAAVYVCTIR
jgi:hypothetical protein